MTSKHGPNLRRRKYRKRLQRDSEEHQSSLGSRPLSERERREILRR